MYVYKCIKCIEDKIYFRRCAKWTLVKTHFMYWQDFDQEIVLR